MKPNAYAANGTGSGRSARPAGLASKSAPTAGYVTLDQLRRRLAAHLDDRSPCFRRTQHERDLLFRKTALLHVPDNQTKSGFFARNSHSDWIRLLGRAQTSDAFPTSLNSSVLGGSNPFGASAGGAAMPYARTICAACRSSFVGNPHRSPRRLGYCQNFSDSVH